MATGGLALVTGASSGIGLELARIAAEDGHDVLAVAEREKIATAVASLGGDGGGRVEPLGADLATPEGIAAVERAVGDRPVACLMANAGVGLGGSFLDQDTDAIERVIDTNVVGTTELLHRIGGRMRDRGEGQILVTASLAGLTPGAFHAVYNATKAYLDNLSWALRNELRDRGVSVTCLMPGPTQTEFFERADLEDTPLGRSEDKADPADVARAGYDAMMAGASGVTPGFMTKAQAALSGLVPDTVLAKMHRRMAEPGGSHGR